MKWDDSRLDERFDHIDRRFDEMDRRFDKVESRLEAMDARFERRFDRIQHTLIVALCAMLGTVAAAIFAGSF